MRSMTFEHEGETYRIEFKRVLALPASPAYVTKATVKKRQIAEKLRAEKAKRKKRTCDPLEVVGDGGRPPATMAQLLRLAKPGEVLVLSDAPPQWVEVMRATVRHYFKDEFTVEDGRKKALQCLTPFIRPDLRPPMWKAYLERPRPKSEPKPKPEEPPTPVIMEGSSPAPESL